MGLEYLDWLDRVVYRYGLFDLRAALAGKVLGLPTYSAQKFFRTAGNLAGVISRECEIEEKS